MFRYLLVVWGMAACLLAGVDPMLAGADSHHHGDKRKRDHARGLGAPQSQLYQDKCGGCHLAYPAELLPSGSWRKIVQGQDKHHGEDLGLTKAEQDLLAKYLEANAADMSSARLARKIMKSLRSQTPLMITQVPYIIHKHEDDDVPRGAFQRKSVGGFANCGACHPGAAMGDFDDHRVRVPAE